MSTRQTRTIFLSTSSGLFPSLSEALAAANAIKIWLQRLCMRKGYACQGTIGISTNSPKDGRVERVKTGKRGRPINTFVYCAKSKPHKNVKPHIHIIIKANPAHTIAKALIHHLNKRFGQAAAQYKDCSAYANTAEDYLQKQSLKVRKITCNPELFSFTDMICSSEPESAENARLSDDEDSNRELQCNNKIELEIVKYYERDYELPNDSVLRSPIALAMQIWFKSGFC